jgi:hypothetical protein
MAIGIPMAQAISFCVKPAAAREAAKRVRTLVCGARSGNGGGFATEAPDHPSDQVRLAEPDPRRRII